MKFRKFCILLQSFFHFEYPKNPEHLKDLSAPINPDRDTRKVGVFPVEETASFTNSLHGLFDKANLEDLDSQVEVGFTARWESEVDFEVDDALAKLKKRNLVERSGNCLIVAPI